jgi:type II secretory pathway pseudopilin PulG
MGTTGGGSRARGFTYLGVLFAVVFMAIALALAGQIWSTLDRRARERQLLFIGAEFRQALTRYYEGSPGTVKQYPLTLEELVRDKRYPDTRRYLRKIYADPFTGKAEWGLVKGPGGAITGIYSLAAGVPIKTDNFGKDFPFTNKKSYAEWIFEHQPSTVAPAATARSAASDPASAAGARKP